MSQKLLAIDLETACAVASCEDHGKSICRNGHSLSPWHGRITLVAVWNTAINSGRVFKGSQLDLVRQYTNVAFENFGIVAHNGKFDLLWLAVHGLEIPLDRWVGDSQLAAYVLTEKISDAWLADYEVERKKHGPHHRKAGKHSLKTLAPYFLGVPAFWEVEDHANEEYALKDAEYTARLVVVLEEKLKALGQYDFYKERLLPWTKLLLQAELRGVELDMGAMDEMESELKGKSAELKARLDEQWAEAHAAYKETQRDYIHERYEKMCKQQDNKIRATADRGGPKAQIQLAMKLMNNNLRYEALTKAAAEKLPQALDYDSPAQMAWLLRDYLGYNIESLEGKDTTGREVLERLAEEGKDDVKTYLEWRKANKLLTAFLPSYRDLAAPVHQERLAGDTGPRRDSSEHRIIHPIFNPTTTRTGRTSSERPNAQQVPPVLRPLFKARDGYSFVGYDQAAIEARLIALYSEDPTLFEIVTSGASLHDYNTKVFFDLDTPIEDVKSLHGQERAAAKNVGFALFYHAGANRVRIAFAQKGFHLSSSQCKQLLERFRGAYRTAFDYARSVVSHMEEGNVLPNLLGRPLRIENPEDCYMQAFNTLVQSSASDLLLEGALQANEAMKACQIEAYPVLFVHDYVCFEVKDAHVAEADEIIQTALTNFDLVSSHGPIRLEVEGGVSKRWEK